MRASKQMVDALKKAGADVKFTRYSELMHDSWTATYDNPDVYRWLLSCRRTVKGEEIAVPQANKVELSNQS